MALIQISNELWKELNSDKQLGETFDDVLKRRLKKRKNENTKNTSV